MTEDLVATANQYELEAERLAKQARDLMDRSLTEEAIRLYERSNENLHFAKKIRHSIAAPTAGTSS